MIKKIALLMMLSSILINAQSKFGTLFFKDGSQKMGFISITKENKILFKKESNHEPLEYDNELVTGFNDNDEYKYVVFNEEPIILKVITEGRINLYMNSFTAFSPGTWSFGGFNAGYSYKAIEYYIQHKNEITVINGKLKKKYDYIFSDCPLVLENLKKRKLKRKRLLEIVEFYNKNCN